MRRILTVLMAGLLTFGMTPSVGAVPDGFEEQELLLNLGGGFATDFVFTPTGEMLLVKKSGELFVFQDPAGDGSYTEQILSLDLTPVLCSNGERGVQGLELHPDFVNTRFIYIYYTYDKNNNCDEGNSAVDRLSRFVLPESFYVDMSSEVVLLDTPPLAYDHHNGGDVAFGNDGYLYVSVGDGGDHVNAVSGDPGNLLGSLIRLTDDGGIPDSNPFVNEANSVRCSETGLPPEGAASGAKCQEIFSIGLRNPFRFSMDPNTIDKVRMYINDVGASTWEEISEGGTDYAGADYGWPVREGPCLNGKTSNCAHVTSYIDPIHFYAHSNGGAATGAAFVPNGIWPAEYDGAYLYGEFVFGNIYLVRDSETPPCFTCDPPQSNKDVSVFTSYGSIINMKFGPYKGSQALYYSGLPTTVRRVYYTGTGNRSPDAVVTANPTEGPVGMTVVFSGALSSDDDNDTLSFSWDFDGDGTIDSTVATGEYNYTASGQYTATLTVTDDQGGKSSTSVEIKVGSGPEPVIVSPPANATFAVGDVITLIGSATDDNGTEVAESRISLSDTSLTWEVRQHHDTHYHPFLAETVGNNIVLAAAPEPEDYAAATNSYLEIILTATDADGISTTVTRNVQPRLFEIAFDTIPSGLDVYLDGSPLTTPHRAMTWEGHGLRVEAPDQIYEGQAYVFDSWSNGGGQTQTIPIPEKTDAVPSFVAQFAKFSEPGSPTAAPGPTTASSSMSLNCLGALSLSLVLLQWLI